MLVQVTILVLVLFALELLLRNRVRAVVRYWLWLLVLVKLVLPVGLHTPASLRLLAAGGAPAFGISTVCAGSRFRSAVGRTPDAIRNASRRA